MSFVDLSDGFLDNLISECGEKARGLASVPATWVPLTFALSFAAQEVWASNSANFGFLVRSSHSLQQFLNRVEADGYSEVAIRSSAEVEGLAERGALKSGQSFTDVVYVSYEATRLWRLAGSVREALLIQPMLRVVAKGHLSNERRLSRNAKEWHVEVEPGGAGLQGLLTFRVNDSIPELPQHLSAKTSKEVEDQLRVVASTLAQKGARWHLEWVWDGQRVWVVQCDQERNQACNSPHTGLIRKGVRPVDGLKVIVPHSKASTIWKKVRNLMTFEEAGLKVARVYVLEDETTLEELISGTITEDLADDLRTLATVPVIVRCDVSTSEATAHNLPRSDPIPDAEIVSSYLVSQAQSFASKGLRPNQFSFLIHRFIPARSGAWSYGRPGGNGVRIDATWGSPEGLQVFPHDSFEVDILPPHKARRKIRCKDRYIAVNPEGVWDDVKCGEPYDWQPSLTRNELEAIAQGTAAIAEKRGKPTSIMWFVGVDQRTGHPSLLPWYAEDGPSELSYSERIQVVAKHRHLVRSERDLNRLEESETRREEWIILSPDADLIRDDAFMTRLIKVAKDRGLIVYLEGSVLAHAYYELVRAGIRVTVLNPFNPRFQQQKFGKLVRDLIPVNIRSHGEEVVAYQLTPDELLRMLKIKAIEEALEFRSARSSDEALEELADLYEVVLAAVSAIGRSYEELLAKAEQKRTERGGFESGLFLVQTRRQSTLKLADGVLKTTAGDDSTGEAGQVQRYLQSLPVARSKGNAVGLSLIPPASSSARRRVTIEIGGQLYVANATYQEKEILLSLALAQPGPSVGQPSLFDDGTD